MKYVIIGDGILYKVSNKLAERVKEMQYSPNEDEVQEVINEVERYGKYVDSIEANLRL